MEKILSLLSGEVKVVNIGLETFALELDGLGVPVVHLAWNPPAGGDAELGRLLAQLEDEA